MARDDPLDCAKEILILRIFFALSVCVSSLLWAEAKPAKSRAPLLESPLAAKSVRRLPQSTRGKGSIWRMGLLASGDGLWSKVDFDDSASKGLGWAAGLLVENRYWPYLRVQLGVQYQFLRLGRSLDGSGTIKDTPVEVEQSVSGVSGRLGVGFLLEGDDPFVLNSGDPHWWLDAGLQYLSPLNAKQTTSFGGETEFEDGGYLFLYVGPSAEFTTGPDSIAAVSLQAVGTAANPLKTFGVRLALALTYGL